MARATDDDNTGLPPNFSYMDPPPGWPPPRSAAELREMALRLEQALNRDRASPILAPPSLPA
jgi:hypothetical protein